MKFKRGDIVKANDSEVLFEVVEKLPDGFYWIAGTKSPHPNGTIHGDKLTLVERKMRYEDCVKEVGKIVATRRFDGGGDDEYLSTQLMGVIALAKTNPEISVDVITEDIEKWANHYYWEMQQ